MTTTIILSILIKLKILLMVLMLLLDVKNLIIITITMIIIIVIMIMIIIMIIIIIMKSTVAPKTALLIKIMSPHHHHHKTQKKLFILKDSIVNSNINALRYDHLVHRKSDVCMIMWSQLYEISIQTILFFIAGLMIWILSEQLLRLPDLLQNLYFCQNLRITTYRYPLLCQGMTISITKPVK